MFAGLLLRIAPFPTLATAPPAPQPQLLRCCHAPHCQPHPRGSAAPALPERALRTTATATTGSDSASDDEGSAYCGSAGSGRAPTPPQSFRRAAPRYVHDPYSFAGPVLAPPSSERSTESWADQVERELSESDDDRTASDIDAEEPTPEPRLVAEGEELPLAAAAPCAHYAHWKRQRSKKDRAFFFCRLCMKSFAVAVTQAANFLCVVVRAPAAAALAAQPAQQGECGPQCAHVPSWRRTRTRAGVWQFDCGACGDSWRVAVPGSHSATVDAAQPLPAGWRLAVQPQRELLFGFY